MVNIKDILMYVYAGVKNKGTRFTVEDDEHILDTKTGVEFHLYDDGGKITHGEKIVAKLEFFTREEQEVLMEIKKLITDPEVIKKKIAHYPVMVRESREAFANLFESPQPVEQKGPVLEENTTPYRG
jgi:hypothetical protein